MYDDRKIGRYPPRGIANMSFSKALDVLRKADEKPDEFIGAHDEVEDETITLPRDAIVTLPNVFQHRTDRAAEDDRGQQVARLAKALKEKPAHERFLEPVLVKEIDEVWVCIDGHHRLMAYEKAGVPEVKAQVFVGSVDEALLEAGAVNGMTKLQMTSRDRQNVAWKLVVADKHSKREIKEAAGVSDGLVAHMRRIKRTLDDNLEDPGEHTWLSARMAAKGETPGERGEDWVEEQVIRYEKGFKKQLGNMAHPNRDLIAEALERNYRSLIETIVERNALDHREMIEHKFAEADEETQPGQDSDF